MQMEVSWCTISKEGNNLKVVYECFVQCVKLWTVRGHTEDVQNYVKLKKLVLGSRHLQENLWLGLLSIEGWLHHDHDAPKLMR
jgi:hypothetical protein